MENIVNQKFNVIRNNIKKYRKEKGYTQEQLAEKSNFSAEYIREIESPTKNKRFSLVALIRIAYCLEIPLQNFFN